MAHSLTFITQDLPFIQRNDNDRTTHFQCPNCYSYNNEQKTIIDDDIIYALKRTCLDCGYSTKYYGYGVEDEYKKNPTNTFSHERTVLNHIRMVTNDKSYTKTDSLAAINQTLDEYYFEHLKGEIQ